jgi:hypothetical protein
VLRDKDELTVQPLSNSPDAVTKISWSLLNPLPFEAPAPFSLPSASLYITCTSPEKFTSTACAENEAREPAKAERPIFLCYS